jgi:hypothetical protein
LGNWDDAPTPPTAPLLPTREELQPGAERAARDLLAALAEGSIVVVDEGRAMAALAEVVVAMHQGATRETARGCVAVLDRLAAGMASAAAQAAIMGAADILCRGYGVTRLGVEGKAGA